MTDHHEQHFAKTCVDQDKNVQVNSASPASGETFYALGFIAGDGNVRFRAESDPPVRRPVRRPEECQRYNTEGTAFHAFAAMARSRGIINDWRLYRVDAVRSEGMPERRRVLQSREGVLHGEYLAYAVLDTPLAAEPLVCLDGEYLYSLDLERIAAAAISRHASETRTTRIFRIAVTPATQGAVEYRVTEVE